MIKCQGCRGFYRFFAKSLKNNNIRERMLDSIYQMTLKLIKNRMVIFAYTTQVYWGHVIFINDYDFLKSSCLHTLLSIVGYPRLHHIIFIQLLNAKLKIYRQY